MLRCPGVGNCQVLKSRGWGIYYILAKTIQIPGVLPGGGMVTAGIDPCITKWLIVMYLKNTGRNSTFRAKFFRREVSPSSRSLPTNSQTKGLRSKRRISLVFPTHFHSHQPSFAIIAIKIFEQSQCRLLGIKINSHIQNYNHSPVTSSFSLFFC